MHSEYIKYKTYEEAFKRIASTDTINKLKRLSQDKNMSLSAYLRFIINDLYDLRFYSNVVPQMGGNI